uniref:Uncharacterized protein n=1 Tax=Globodera rostochiensis TaxID=31243 RepID=A0A914HBA9_GLORO
MGIPLCLLSYGTGLDERADSGKMTASYFANSKRNLQITCLLPLGADPNLAVTSVGDEFKMFIFIQFEIIFEVASKRSLHSEDRLTS